MKLIFFSRTGLSQELPRKNYLFFKAGFRTDSTFFFLGKCDALRKKLLPSGKIVDKGPITQLYL